MRERGRVGFRAVGSHLLEVQPERDDSQDENDQNSRGDHVEGELGNVPVQPYAHANESS